MQYRFRCTCGKMVTVDHSIYAPHPETHKGCGGKLTRLFEPAAIHYRGSGFFSTDSVLQDATEDEKLAAEYTHS
jgi:predicted nucleic acid-binding Zn ribbon protein